MKRLIGKVIQHLPMNIKATLARKAIRINPKKIEDLEFKIAQGINELEQAYSLVGRAYYDEEYMTKNKPRIQSYNTHPESTTLIAKEESNVIATMSLMQDTQRGLSLDALYESELDNLRNQGRKIAEVGLLATNKEYRGSKQMIPMGLNQITLRYAQHLKIDDLVIGIHPKHEHIYRGVLLFESLGERKLGYKHVNNAPIVSLRLNLKTAKEVWRKAYENKGPKRNVHDFVFNPSFNDYFSSIKLPQWTPEISEHFKNDIIRDPATQSSKPYQKQQTSEYTITAQ